MLLFCRISLGLFLQGLIGFGGCSKAVPLRRGSWSWRSRSTTRPPGLCWMVHGSWPTWFSGFWSSPRRSSEKQTFATAWWDNCYCTWFSKSFLILRWLITHPPPVMCNLPVSCEALELNWVQLDPQGDGIPSLKGWEKGPWNFLSAIVTEVEITKADWTSWETNIADLNAAWGAPGNGCFFLHFSNLSGF